MERTRIFVWLLTSFWTLRCTTSVVVSCGENMCLCDEKTFRALCKPVHRKPNLLYFPTLPSYINDVTFEGYKRHAIYRADLKNLTYLPLRYLQMKHMDISKMEKGLFRSLSLLKILEILHNRNLSSVVLREAFRNISPTLEELILTSNNMKTVEPDMFKYVSNTQLTTLILARNPLFNLQPDIFENLNLTALDLGFSRLRDLRKICPKHSILTSLKRLSLKSTKLTNIPKRFLTCFPNLQKLHLEENKFDSFPEFCDTWSNSTNNLQELYLGNTGIDGNISSIDTSCLKNLTLLKLDRNKLYKVPNFCNSEGSAIFPSLKKLYLQKTSISSLPKSSFRCLSSLQVLDLRNNIISKLPNFCNKNNSFSYTPNLATLYLSNTSIVTLNNHKLRCLENLKELDLRLNFLRSIPPLWFCNEFNNSLIPILRKLDLSSNPIEFISSENFLCLSSVKILRLTSTSISKLDDNLFSTMRSLQNLEIGYTTSLKRISKHAFNVSSLSTLTFSFNNFNFEDVSNYFPDQLFNLCENVSTLILNGNHFPTTPVAYKILKPLQKLEHLSLLENRMHTIHEETLKSSISLKKLLLGQNRLTGWSENVFKNLSELRYLDIGDNKIAVFNKTSLPISILDSLETLNLAYNPFDCGCDMIWFKNWVLKTNVTLLSFPTMYSCKTPPNMFRRPLLSLNLTEEDCKKNNPWLIVILSVSAGALLLLLVFTTIFIQMPTIKNYMYYLRLRKMGYVKLINEEEFKYDAYVVYCESDENWIFHTLVPKLESEGLRLCIPDREFEVGANKCDQIVSAFKESKKILVVLSDNFAKNEWCLWQFNLVEERIRHSGDSAVVFVLYKNISSKSMISCVHRTLKKRSILTWYEGGNRGKMFWKVIVLALEAPLGEPPVSVIN